MSREIKFQILFNVIDKNLDIKVESTHTTLDRLISGLDKVNYQELDIIAKRQFTGLKDKNGVEIYEGDIVKCFYDELYDQSIHIVEYYVDWDYPAFDISKNPVEDCNGLSHFLCSGFIEVIGNIHENPELLEDAD